MTTLHRGAPEKSLVPWVPTAAVAVALASFFVATYSACQTWTAQRLAVAPRIHLDFRYRAGDRASIHVLNVGVGPAEVEALTVRLDGREQSSWRQLLTSIGAGTTRDLIYGRYPRGTFYKAGYEGVLIEVTGPEAAAAFSKAFNRLEIAACYCSLYDDCWRVELPKYTTTKAPDGCPAPAREMDE